MVRAKHQPLAVGNDRELNFIVSDLFFTDFCNSHVSAALSAQDFQGNIRVDVAVEPPSHSNGGSSIHRARRVAELSAAGADAVLRVPDVCSSIRTHGCL